MLGLTRTAAAEVAGRGVRVNAVLPGMIDTRMLRALAEATFVHGAGWPVDGGALATMANPTPD